MPEKLYYAKDLTVWKSPVREKVEGGERLSVGFPVCTVSDYVGEEGAEAVAELLVLGEAVQNEAPKPRAARELLEAIDIKAEAGLCYFNLGSARAFLQDIRDLVAPHLADPEVASDEAKQGDGAASPPCADEVSRATSRLLQQLAAIPTKNVTQHDRDVRTLIDALSTKDSSVPDWVIKRVETCVLDSNAGEYAGLADHAAFEAGQDNAVVNVVTMLRAANKKDSTDV